MEAVDLSRILFVNLDERHLQPNTLQWFIKEIVQANGKHG